MENLLIIIILLIIAHFIGKAGEKRKIGYGASFALSFFLGFIGWIFVFTSRKLTAEELEELAEKERIRQKAVDKYQK